MDLKKLQELAEGLSKSNVQEVKELAKGFLGLKVAYDELQHTYTLKVAEGIMNRHYNLLKRLED